MTKSKERERCPACGSDQLEARAVATHSEHFNPPLKIYLYKPDRPEVDLRRLVAALCLDCGEVRFKGREQL